MPRQESRLAVRFGRTSRSMHIAEIREAPCTPVVEFGKRGNEAIALFIR